MFGYLETSRWIYYHGLNIFDRYDTKSALMPAFTESIYSISYVFDNEYGAKIFEGFVSLILLILIFSFSHKRLSVETSVIITISFFCLDEFQWLIGSGKIDIVSQTMYISSLYLLFDGAFKDEKVKASNIYFSIFFLLIAMASKYTNYIFVPLHLMVLSYYLSTKKINLKTFIRFGAFGISAFLIVVAPHFVRDYYLNGNPFSPIPNPWFTDRMPIKSIQLNDENYIFNYYPLRNYILFPYYFFAKHTVNSHSSLALFPMTFLFAITLCFAYKMRFNWRENMPFIFVCVQFVIWLLVFNKYWLVERYIFGLIFLLFFFIFSVLDKVPISDLAKKLCLFFLIAYCALFIYNDKKYIHDLKFVLNKESLSTWQDTQNGRRKANLVAKIVPMMDSAHRLFNLSGLILLYIPNDKLGDLSNNYDEAAFDKLNESQQLNFLRDRKFKYLIIITKPPKMPSYLTSDKIIYHDGESIIYKID